ncbi:predicted protein [Naegleria gruberi]|uniref:Predicted protein n=1 Tax=Naegleria gruberi TaxID=5762 RepID=D2VLQ1_NAEGR|nr:uncharacterized protein NAEGRDRAFT_69859 [Naegleria gruberi]EFC42099.1 predicted protein [Naegleria gruberi]|eukprot:XP_002674843.1 predicted protein [Naegleria gruberi strain NEG-M]
MKKVPVSVITGFLGSGKTTLINYILTQPHGYKIAIIENEFGEVGIDDALVVQANEEIFEMNNGCICCTVRGDLIRILGRLAKRKDKFDYILVETSGMADPAPVAQTFFVDDDISEQYYLDGIITIVDAKHILQHLLEERPKDEENESVEQIAFADRIILNKIDLLKQDESSVSLEEVKKHIQSVNKFAPIIETNHSIIPDLSSLLNIRSFDVQKILQMDPDFLKDMEHTHDTSVGSVAIVEKGMINQQLFSRWLRGLLSEKGADIYRSKGIVKSQELADEDSQITNSNEEFVMVFQGVHMMMDMKVMPVAKSKVGNVNKLVFIGKNLNRQELEQGFRNCLQE